MKLNYLFGFLILLVHSSNSSLNCRDALNDIALKLEYSEESLELLFRNVQQINETLEACLGKTKDLGVELVLELVSLQDSLNSDNCCKKPCKDSRVQDEVYLSNIISDPSFTFRYVEGLYFYRFRRCSCPNEYCTSCRTILCSETQSFQVSSEDKSEDGCGDMSLSYLNKHTRFSFTQEEENCTLEIKPVFPSCSPILHYSQAEISVFQTEENETCPGEFEGLDKLHSSQRNIYSCNSTLCPTVNLFNTSLGFLSYDFEAEMNSSYCILIEQRSPFCEVNPEPCSVYYDTPVKCRPYSNQAILVLPLSEPIFIGCVCGILFLSLLLLLWTVVKCKKEQTTPNSSPEPELIKEKNIPRSLTIDEMEHICRLRHQELVLVYFPDTERFKDLNRLFKNWLLSLSILNVNDVTDVYDEKFTEGPDGILENPDGWVSNLLSDQERRVILVTSKLAYECLVHLRKGLAPPKFPNYEAHSQLLFSILKLLDSEMFRGNYRRLMCVRYEDLKICDRRYGSESFNIVPGTEYLLPQHLEDVARWIHPVEAKPGLWAEHRPQVRNLLDSLKQYRHHEDNIFTVSFYDGENGTLLGHEFKNGF